MWKEQQILNHESHPVSTVLHRDFMRLISRYRKGPYSSGVNTIHAFLTESALNSQTHLFAEYHHMQNFQYPKSTMKPSKLEDLSAKSFTCNWVATHASRVSLLTSWDPRSSFAFQESVLIRKTIILRLYLVWILNAFLVSEGMEEILQHFSLCSRSARSSRLNTFICHIWQYLW